MPAKFFRQMSGVLVAAKRQTVGPVRHSRGALRACPAPWCFAPSGQDGLIAAARGVAMSHS